MARQGEGDTTQEGVNRPGDGSTEAAARSDVTAVLFDLDRTLIAGAGRATRLAAHWYGGLRRRVVLTPEARRVLAVLDRAGIPYGIVTNGRARKRQTLRLLGLEQRAACVVVSEEHGRRKPDSALFRQASDALGVQPEQVLFVGDDPNRDVQGAHAAGMRTAWLCGGRAWPWSRPSADAADAVMASLGDVLAILGLQPHAR